VRFDKYGLYGIDIDSKVDGLSWVAKNTDEISDKATFALTWDGLKIKYIDNNTNNTIEAHIGRTKSDIVNITQINSDQTKTPLFVVGTEGNV
jgi:hypothetical protein